MATDQSPPRLRLIISIAVGAVVMLVSLKFILESYFTDIMEEAAASKLVTPDELNAMHATEAAKLTNSPAIPIDQAMTQLSTQGRLGSTSLTPQPSDDVGALIGWTLIFDPDQAQARGGMPPAPATTASGASTQNNPPGPPPGFDGGAAIMPGANQGKPSASSDAGAPKPRAPNVPAASADAGAPH